jgi:hypothetical protein
MEKLRIRVLRIKNLRHADVPLGDGLGRILPERTGG